LDEGSKVLTVITNPVTFSIGGSTRLELWIAPPHTKADLTQRVVYDSTGPRNEPIYQTTPIRGGGSGSGSSSSSGSYHEEDL
jgi:hypothetical protein